jgi:hypothetical protein
VAFDRGLFQPEEPMTRLAAALLATGCTAAMQPPHAGLACSGPVSCGRDQLFEADQALQHAVQRRGPAAAFGEVLLADARYLLEGKGIVSGRQQIEVELGSSAPFIWTAARGDVSAGAELGYTFGWTSSGAVRGHYAAVWKRQGGDWKLAVFMKKPAKAQEAAPPAWFAPFRGEREAGPPAAQSVSAADAAFAALARATGSTQQAFTTYAAQDAVRLAATMVFGRDAIHDLLQRAPLIEWAPIAEDSASDLGYTVGAYQARSARGNYLTIWRLQSDGAWRFVLDGGVKG